MDFRLRFKPTAIPYWAARCSYPGEDEMLARVPPRVRAAGHLTRHDLEVPGAWKSPRIRSRIASNDDGFVREVTRIGSGAPEVGHGI
jgi:hypothetical protein